MVRKSLGLARFPYKTEMYCSYCHVFSRGNMLKYFHNDIHIKF